MHTKSSHEKIAEAFGEVFRFDDPVDQHEVDTQVLIAKFLSEIQHASDAKGLNRKELAALIGISPSFLTQVFRGNKLLNIATLAKFQRALGIEFHVRTQVDSGQLRPFGEEEVIQLLDKWLENKPAGEYIKIVRSAATVPAREPQPYIPGTENINAA